MIRSIQLGTACATFLLTVGSMAVAAPILSVNGNRVAAGEEYQLDLNNDGIRDFEFSVTEDGNDAFIRAILQDEVPAQTFDPSFQLGSDAFVVIVAPGETIDASTFRKGKVKKKTGGNIYSSLGGPFGVVGSTGYIPLRLRGIESGDIHYGFAQLTRGSITIGEVGFESVPNVPIAISSSTATVPEPTSLALLASGAVVLLAYRRCRRPTATM